MSQCAFFILSPQWPLYYLLQYVKLNDFLHSDRPEHPFSLLFGHPVDHSLSPLMHNTAAEYYHLDLHYTAVDVNPRELERLPALLNHENFRGANITIPYKTSLLEMMDELDESSRAIGAINTIERCDGRLIGHNTDAWGFAEPLVPYAAELEGERAVVFGTGGAARAVVFALTQMGLQEIVLVSRHPGRFQPDAWGDNVILAGYEAWTAYADDSMILVNTTPLGMGAKGGRSPVRNEEKQYLAGRICYDLIYRPAETVFLQFANLAGGIPIGGLDMLIYQGSRSFEYWTGHTFPFDLVKKRISDE